MAGKHMVGTDRLQVDRAGKYMVETGRQQIGRAGKHMVETGRYQEGRAGKPKTTKLILLDSLLQEVEETLPHLVFQIKPGPRLGIKTAKCNCSREST